VAAGLIALVGPTAAGKTHLGLRLAEEVGGEIVSCDSLQVYRGLDIGSAKPSVEERRRVLHHLIDVVEPDEAFSAADYARLARRSIGEIAARGRRPLVVGGAGLYLRALLDGLFEGPSRDEELRRRLEALAARYGDARLHRVLARVDPAAAARIRARDRVRVVRALEVFRATRRPISERQRLAAQPPLRGFDVLVLGLAPPRGELRARVERRTDEMLDHGLVEEARGLLERYPEDLMPLRAIGYRQAVDVARGRCGIEAARRDIVAKTMRYAKRQLTWFRHQTQATWCGTPALAREAALAWLAERDRA
jgi:tRNA dimethylallyltransferase